MIRILHVDDDRIAFEVTKLSLNKVAPDLDITWSTSGEDALRVLERREFDCVISDFQMPEMNGLELLKELRKQNNDIPFIFLTGQSNEQRVVDALRAGSDDYFTKEKHIAHYQRIAHSIRRHVDAVNDKRQREIASGWLRRSNSILRAILETTSSGFFATDSYGNIETTNMRFLEILDVPNDTLIGSIGDLGKCLRDKTNDPETVIESLRKMTESLDGEDTISFELLNGKSVEMTANQISIDNYTVGKLVCINDVTDKANAKKEINSLIRFLDGNLSIMIRVNQDGIITLANKASTPLLKKWKTKKGGNIPAKLRNILPQCLESSNELQMIETFGMDRYFVTLDPVKEAGFVNFYAQKIEREKEFEEKIEALYQIWIEARNALLDSQPVTIRKINE